MRAVFLIAGLVLGFHAANAISAVGDACVQGCEDDAPDGTCPPNCADCICCGHQAPAVVDSFTLVPPTAHDGGLFASDTDDQPASADPRELQHIPKSLLG